MNPCDKSLYAEIPGTQVRIQHFCTKRQGHEGHCIAHGTLNGTFFEIEFETSPKKPI